MYNEDADIDSMVTTFNTAVTETASEIPSKHRQKKKTWVTAENLDLCDRVNNKIKRCMKKAKENWIGEQCGEVEKNLTKNNSKRAYQLVKDLITETRESYCCPRSFRKMPHRRTTGTEPMDTILF